MTAGVVGVDEVRPPGPDAACQPPHGAEPPDLRRRDGADGETRGTRPSQQLGIRRGHDERFVTRLTLGAGQEEGLALSAPPRPARVDVENPHGDRLTSRPDPPAATRGIAGSVSGATSIQHARPLVEGSLTNRETGGGPLILANVRQRLTRDDAQLVLRLVARGSEHELASAEESLRDHGLDALLDDPRLLPALIESRQAAHASLPLFAYVVVRNALRGVDEHDRGISDYVASIVVHFATRDHANRIAAGDDEVYDTLAALLADVDRGEPARRFLVRAHLGNYALWLSGLFPDHVEERRWRRGGPDLDYYDEMGQRGFALAAQHRLARQYGMEQLYEATAARFPRIRTALNSVSDRLLFPNRSTPERLMRQVHDEVRWRRPS